MAPHISYSQITTGKLLLRWLEAAGFDDILLESLLRGLPRADELAPGSWPRSLMRAAGRHQDRSAQAEAARSTGGRTRWQSLLTGALDASKAALRVQLIGARDSIK